MLTYQLDRNARKSMYVELSDRIRHDIESGILPAGEKLPSKRLFAEHLGVSLATIEASYSQLIEEGFIRAEPRKGYFVNQLESFDSQSACLTETATDHRNSPSESGIATDLSRFETSLHSIPEKTWFKTIREVMNEEDPHQLLDTDPQGSLRLRKAIAQELLGFRGIATDPDNVVVGAGAQYLYVLLSQLLIENGSWAVENPGYPKLEKTYRSMGLKVSPIPLDSDGMIVDELRKSGARIAHVTPSHQFPTGTIMSAPRRYELLAWANEDQRYIIEDDYDCEFRLKGRPMPSLKGIDANGRVIYMNTFSRSLWPGIRIAYAVLPSALMRKLKTNLGFYSCSVSTFEQIALARFIELGRFDSHLNRTRKRYRSLRDSLIHTLESKVNDKRVRTVATDAGLHFIIEIDGGNELLLKREIAKNGVHITGMHDYYSNATLVPNSGCAKLLVNYAGLAEDVAIETMNVIASCIAQYTQNKPC